MPKRALLCSLLSAAPSFAMPNDTGFLDRFPRLSEQRWHVAEYDFTHPSFDTDWRHAQVRPQQGLRLAIAPHSDGPNAFAGGSIRTKDILHYGRYSARIQPAKGPGLITGFFTYTGPYYGTRHDEIDIEFLGKDTTKLHLAWFVNGELHQKDVALGFDASTCLHSYAFDWTPTGIEWYVNGISIYAVTAETAPIPRVPSRLYLNIWAADRSIAQWAGRAAPDARAVAHIRSVSFTPYLATKPES